MTYPSPTLYPSLTLFPSAGGAPSSAGYAQPQQVDLGGLVLTATDEFGCDWMADTLGGWYGSPSSTIQLNQKPRGPGAWASQSRQMTPRVLTVAGAVDAPSPDVLEGAIDRLNAAASLEDTLFTVTENGRSRSLLVARQDVVLINRVSDLLAEFSLQLVAADPRKKGAPLTGSTKLSSTAGGVGVPFGVPFGLVSSGSAGIVTLVNPGNLTGPVTLRINGPVTGPIVTHVGTGAQLIFASSLILAAGDWLDIDMEAQTVLHNGQTSRNSYVTQRGWSGFEPGINSWAFTSQGFSAAARLDVAATPAWD